MLRPASDRPHLHLLVHDRGWRLAAGDNVLAAQDLGPDHDLQTLNAALDALAVTSAASAGSLDVSVCDRWVQSFDVEPAAGARSLDDLRQLAQLRRQSLFGGRGTMRLAADWRPRGRFVSVAVPDSLISVLQSLCRRHGWRLASVYPNWSAALSQPDSDRVADCVAVLDGRVVTLVQRVAGRPAWVRTQMLPQAATQDDARRLLERSLLAVPGLSSQALASCIDLQEAGDANRPPRSRTFDFNRAQSAWRRPSNGVLFLLSCVFVGVLMASAIAVRHWVALGDERSTLVANLDRAAKSARPTALAKPPQASPEQVGSARLLAARLDAPWFKWLRSFEASAHPDTTLLSLDIDGPSARMRGVALARNPRAMLAYVERLREQDGLREARLLRHDTVEKLPGEPLRFEFTNEPSAAAEAAGTATTR